MPRRSTICPRALEVYGNNALCAHFPRWTRGHGIRKHSVHKIAAAYFNGKEHPGIRATGAHWINYRTGMKDHTLPRIEVSRGDAQGNLQLFESFALQGAG